MSKLYPGGDTSGEVYEQGAREGRTVIVAFRDLKGREIPGKLLQSNQAAYFRGLLEKYPDDYTPEQRTRMEAMCLEAENFAKVPQPTLGEVGRAIAQAFGDKREQK